MVFTQDCWLNSEVYCFQFRRSQINFGSLNQKRQSREWVPLLLKQLLTVDLKLFLLKQMEVYLQKVEQKIKSGRMLFVLDDPSVFGDAYDIDLLLLLRSNRLINAFPEPLDGIKIEMAIYAQQLKLKGKFDALIGDANSNENIQIWKFNSSQNEPSNRPKGTINKLLKVK